MDKQKQIDELEKDIAVRMAMAKGVAGSMNNGVEGWLGKYLIEKDWVKIPEGAVVLTDKKDIQQYEWSKMCDKMGIFKLVEKESAKARKETAEKFAERLKEKLNEWLEDNEDLNGKIDFGIAMIELIGVKSLDGEVIAESLIDEICEEITEEKDV